ncbi:MAG: sensor histidine kinase [Rhizomicrobium sp.]|jgi:signal transduction histidine kinase
MPPTIVKWLAEGDEALRRSRATAIVASVVLTLLVGLSDYVTGAEVSVSAFYLIPITLAAWFVGFRFGLLIAAASVGCWVTVNVINNDDEFATFILGFWNAAVQFASDVVVVVIVTRIRILQRSLEDRVRERAAALTQEIAERERLQRELLKVSEREQRRIGRDLHDGLCQHLAGTAIAGQVLREKLAKSQLPEAGDAQRVVELIQEGVLLSRHSAKGLHPLEFDAAGLMLALEEFATTTGKLFRINCRFECDSPVLVHDATTAEHMYRIVQEAVRNAISHGQARSIVVRLETLEEGQELRIEDDGVGIPKEASAEGMGLRIMAHRAREIGGTFRIESRAGRGTVVSCTLPVTTDAEEVVQ